MLMSGQDINLSTENAILMFSCHSRTTDGCKVCGVAIRTHRSSPSCATRSCQYAGLEPDVTVFRLALKARTGLGLVVVQSERNRALSRRIIAPRLGRAASCTKPARRICNGGVST